MAASKGECWILNLGLRDYSGVYNLQKKLVNKRMKGEIPDVLILNEHNPVFTIGRKGGKGNILVSEEELKKRGIKIYEIDRGGDVIYHGPGQLVGYPIIDLKSKGKDIHLYLRNLEEVIIRLLKDYGVRSKRIEGYTGVWVGNEKIAAIGIGVKRWISFHGFCLNVNPNFSYFNMINPCGIKDREMTSLERLTNFEDNRKGEVKLAELTDNFIKHFGEVFSLEMINKTSLASLLSSH
ncbi:MAG: lipoyl(octanoyl) transferase LipB [Candidatus Aerophobetes bacterium]|nr:lipoyl(octanoyl) transferase LipB [Candidatus Aerophobetes bacterium]